MPEFFGPDDVLKKSIIESYDPDIVGRLGNWKVLDVFPGRFSLKVLLSERPSYVYKDAFFGFAGAVAPKNTEDFDVFGEFLEMVGLLLLRLPILYIILFAALVVERLDDCELLLAVEAFELLKSKISIGHEAASRQ